MQVNIYQNIALLSHSHLHCLAVNIDNIQACGDRYTSADAVIDKRALQRADAHPSCCALHNYSSAGGIDIGLRLHVGNARVSVAVGYRKRTSPVTASRVMFLMEYVPNDTDVCVFDPGNIG